MPAYNPILDSDQYHVDEILDGGPALEAVRFIYIDREAAANRNLRYIRENVAREKEFQEKLA